MTGLVIHAAEGCAECGRGVELLDADGLCLICAGVAEPCPDCDQPSEADGTCPDCDECADCARSYGPHARCRCEVQS